jgi:hypothetical protein
VIDLHLHTTASDGTCPAAALVQQLVRAGVRAFSVTDHDTTAGLDEARAFAARAGLEFVNGIEITAVLDGDDVHVLGYAFDPRSRELARFLEGQRADRIRRARDISRRLADLGVPIDVDSVIAAATHHGGRAVGRPLLADALVRAGHARSRREAFARYLGRDKPAFVPRHGASPEDVVAAITSARGLASLAHPGLLRDDSWIPRLVSAGLAALEAFHPDHDAARRERYSRMARRLGLAVSGGSDFHGEDAGRPRPLGCVTLPRRRYERLLAEARARDCADVPPRPHPAMGSGLA